MNIPTQKECLELVQEMGMMAHIVDHSQQVCRVAVCLAGNLNMQGKSLNLALIRAAALLHDITKTRSFSTHENHAETGGKLLQERGFAEVGQIIAQHVKLESYTGLSKLPGEAEIVNYADKRVLHDQIVSLTERMTYILDRYADSQESRERILGLWNKSKEIEKKIFDYLPFQSEALKQIVEMENL